MPYLDPALPGRSRPDQTSGVARSPLKMLLLGPSEPEARRTEAMLIDAGLNLHAVRVEDAVRFRHQLVHVVPDIVLVDDAVPALHAHAAVRLVREHYADLPVIVVSDGMDDEAAADLIMSGASAYMRREHLDGVVSAVRIALAEAARRRQHHEMEAQNAALARTDPLTGLPNRSAFFTALKAHFSAAQRRKQTFGVFYLDFDYFSDVNDSLGHPAGDTLLCIAAERLHACLRGTDVLARLGGDEFAILQTRVRDPAECGELAAHIHESLSASFELVTAQRMMTVSIGIALADGTAETPEEVMAQADIALYRAKETGRNRFCFYSRDIDSAVRERQMLSEELRTAVEAGQFELRFAPQVTCDTRRIVAIEALTVWHNPRRGPLFPEQYFPIAERNGTVGAIAEWSLGQACRALAAWRDGGIAPVPVVVKLCRSHHQTSGCLSPRLAAMLERWGIPPSLLVLSFSEEAFADVTRTNPAGLAAMAATGVGFSVDTFGEGHLPISLLQDYPVSRIKIDRAVHNGTNIAVRDLKLVTAIGAMAAALGIGLVVGGVASEAEAAALAATGRPALQGAAIGDAVAPGVMAASLRAAARGNA